MRIFTSIGILIPVLLFFQFYQEQPIFPNGRIFPVKDNSDKVIVIKREAPSLKKMISINQDSIEFYRKNVIADIALTDYYMQQVKK